MGKEKGAEHQIPFGTLATVTLDLRWFACSVQKKMGKIHNHQAKGTRIPPRSLKCPAEIRSTELP